MAMLLAQATVASNAERQDTRIYKKGLTRLEYRVSQCLATEPLPLVAASTLPYLHGLTCSLLSTSRALCNPCLWCQFLGTLVTEVVINAKSNPDVLNKQHKWINTSPIQLLLVDTTSSIKQVITSSTLKLSACLWSWRYPAFVIIGSTTTFIRGVLGHLTEGGPVKVLQRKTYLERMPY